MKKMISVTLSILLLVSLFALNACGGGKDSKPAAAPDDGAPAAQETGSPYLSGKERFSLFADKTTVSPGDTVTVTLHAENCKNVACFELLISASEGLTDAVGKEKDVGDFITTVSDKNGAVDLTAIIATTSTVKSLDMLTVTYKVSEDAASGDELIVEGSFRQFLVGTDESGDETADVTDLIPFESLTLTVG